MFPRIGIFTCFSSLGSLLVCMIQIAHQDEKSIWVGLLLLTDMLIHFIQCLIPIVVNGAGRDINSNKQYG